MSGTANRRERREKKRRRKEHRCKDGDDEEQGHEECDELPTRLMGLSYDTDAIRASLKQKDDEIARLNGEVARVAEGKVLVERALREQVVRMQVMAREHKADRAKRGKELKDVQEKIGEAEDRQERLTAQLAEKAAELVQIKEELELCTKKIAAKKQKCATLKGKLADVERQRDNYKQNEALAAGNAKRARDHYKKQIDELRRQLKTERQLGVEEGKGAVAAVSAVADHYESKMRELLQNNDELKQKIENMMPVYNTASAFAAAVHGGVPVQKSIADNGPVIESVE